MTRWTLEQVAGAIRASWSADTCDPVDLPWSADNPSKGQCGVSALVVHDLMGGDVISADVLFADGSRQGHHCWNRLPDGVELDLTREQFRDGEVVQPGTVLVRPPGPPRRCAEQYAELTMRVRSRLESSPPSPHLAVSDDDATWS